MWFVNRKNKLWSTIRTLQTVNLILGHGKILKLRDKGIPRIWSLNIYITHTYLLLGSKYLEYAMSD